MSKKVSTNKFNEGLCHNIFSGIIVFFNIDDPFIILFMIAKNIKGLIIAHDMGNSI